MRDRLAPHREEMEEAEFVGYTGHVYRVLNFTLYLLQSNGVTLSALERECVETALVYHDIALWVGDPVHPREYIKPSVEMGQWLFACFARMMFSTFVFGCLICEQRGKSTTHKAGSLIKS